MKFYEKYFPNNYEELIIYYPRFYRDVFEMVEILKADGRIFDGLEDDIEQVFLQCFIDFSGEAAISKLEKFLHIAIDKNRTLEERRRIIKPYFAGFGKVSASSLEAMIKSYTEAEVKSRFEPYDEAGNHALFIDISRGEKEAFYINDILRFLKMKIPAHIFTKANVNYRQYAKIRNLAFLNLGPCLKVKPLLMRSRKAEGGMELKAASFAREGLKVKPALPQSITEAWQYFIRAAPLEGAVLKVKPLLQREAQAAGQAGLKAALSTRLKLKTKPLLKKSAIITGQHGIGAALSYGARLKVRPRFATTITTGTTRAVFARLQALNRIKVKYHNPDALEAGTEARGSVRAYQRSRTTMSIRKEQ